MKTAEKMTPEQLRDYYKNQVNELSLAIYPAICHSILIENMNLYRALKDAQKALAKALKEFDKVTA
jgi:hypothetical protein